MLDRQPSQTRSTLSELVIKKIDDAANMIDGPAGVSQSHEAESPKTIALPPIAAATPTICSGLFANDRAAAAGKINMAVINNTPTS